MKIVKILPKLPVIKVSKQERRGEKSKAIEKENKFLKRLLITLAKIQIEESMACLSETIQDNSIKMIIEIPLLKFLIRSALILPVVVMIKSISGLLPDLVFV